MWSLIIGNGRIIVISISKIKNISIIEKKWIEKEIRELVNGSNPHSKGDIFSRSVFLCILINGIILIIIIIINMIIIMKYVDIIIILSF